MQLLTAKQKIYYKYQGRKALSLIELLTTIVIMGVLTTAAIPLGEVVFIRDRELELKETLITTRAAIDKFHASVGRYPYSFNELRWIKSNLLLDSKERQELAGIGMPFLRKSPPINPFASSNQAWMVILTNSPDGLEQKTVADFLTAPDKDIMVYKCNEPVYKCTDCIKTYKIIDPSLKNIPCAQCGKSCSIHICGGVYKVEDITVNQINCPACGAVCLKDQKQIYDIQFPRDDNPAFKYQIAIFTSLEGRPYSSW